MSLPPIEAMAHRTLSLKRMKTINIFLQSFLYILPLLGIMSLRELIILPKRLPKRLPKSLRKYKLQLLIISDNILRPQEKRLQKQYQE
jgi:hypothetical protein